MQLETVVYRINMFLYRNHIDIKIINAIDKKSLKESPVYS